MYRFRYCFFSFLFHTSFSFWALDPIDPEVSTTQQMLRAVLSSPLGGMMEINAFWPLREALTRRWLSIIRTGRRNQNIWEHEDQQESTAQLKEFILDGFKSEYFSTAAVVTNTRRGSCWCSPCSRISSLSEIHLLGKYSLLACKDIRWIQQKNKGSWNLGRIPRTSWSRSPCIITVKSKTRGRFCRSFCSIKCFCFHLMEYHFQFSSSPKICSKRRLLTFSFNFFLEPLFWARTVQTALALCLTYQSFKD